MIIPVRCFTCNKVLGDKWEHYKKKVSELQENGEIDDAESSRDVVSVEGGRAPRGKVLDDMGITRICCRRHLLTHVDFVDII